MSSSECGGPMTAVPEINLSDPAVLDDPVSTYNDVRERCPMAKTAVPGLGTLWIVTRHEEARAMLGDPRFEVNSGSFLRAPGIPEDCRPYLRTMAEVDGRDHLRLRRLIAPAFAPRRAARYRPRIDAIVARLLDGLAGPVDLLAEFARPLPMEVICEFVGIPEADR